MSRFSDELSKVQTVSLAPLKCKGHHALALGLGHCVFVWAESNHFPPTQVAAALSEKNLVCANAPRAVQMLRGWRIEVDGLWDVEVMALLASGAPFSAPPMTTSIWEGEGVHAPHIREAATQAQAVLSAFHELREQLEQQGSLSTAELEFWASPYLGWMQSSGVIVDTERMSQHFDQAVADVAADPEESTRKGRKASALVAAYGRRGQRLKPTSVTLPRRLVSQVNACGTSTGRVTHTSPPVQSLPRDLRDIVVAPEGHTLVEIDYKAVDMRVVAQASGDVELRRAFESGVDVHALCASSVLGKPAAEVTNAEREIAKSVNFGAVYGASAKALAKDNNLDEEMVQAFLAGFFARCSGVGAWHHRVKALPVNQVRSLGGRPYHPGSQPDSLPRRLAHIGQGTTADGLKAAMPELSYWLSHTYSEGLRTLTVGIPLLTVYDSVLLEVSEAYAEWLVPKLEVAMCKGLQRYLPDVPVEVSVKCSRRWGGAQ